MFYYEGKVFNAEPGRYYLDDDGWHKKTDEEFNNEKAAEKKQYLVNKIYEIKAAKAYGGIIINDLLVFETNQTSSHSENSSELKTEIITITDSDRNENGLIKQINPPRYQGAIIICQGANDPKVRLAVTDAVSKITGLGADRIAVLIMK